MVERKNWSWDETLAAFVLYMSTPTNRHVKGDKDVIALANKLGRSPGAVAFKLGNIKANDPNKTGKGLVNGSKLDLKVWQEYELQGEELIEKAMGAYGDFYYESEEETPASGLLETLQEGSEREVTTTQRIGQTYFRNSLLDNYDRRCCITGIRTVPLLMASHIKPWKAASPHEKTDASNGLLLNALHDRAFDQGLITLNNELEIVVSNAVPKDGSEGELLWRYDGQPIRLPSCNGPGKEFIAYHNDVVFQG